MSKRIFKGDLISANTYVGICTQILGYLDSNDIYKVTPYDDTMWSRIMQTISTILKENNITLICSNELDISENTNDEILSMISDLCMDIQITFSEMVDEEKDHIRKMWYFEVISYLKGIRRAFKDILVLNKVKKLNDTVDSSL